MSEAVENGATSVADLMWQPIGPRRAAKIAWGMVDALQSLHERGEVHGGLEPDLVRIKASETGELVEVRPREDKLLTLENAETTTRYAAPEQLSGELNGPTADLFSIGRILHEMVSGHRPKVVEDADGTLHPAPLERLPSQAAFLQPVLDRLTHQDPTRRFATTQAAREALERSLAGRSIDGPESATAEPSPALESTAAEPATSPTLELAESAMAEPSPALECPTLELAESAMAETPVANADLPEAHSTAEPHPSSPARPKPILVDLDEDAPDDQHPAAASTPPVPPLAASDGLDPRVDEPAPTRWRRGGIVVALLAGVAAAVAFVAVPRQTEPLPATVTSAIAPTDSPAVAAPAPDPEVDADADADAQDASTAPEKNAQKSPKKRRRRAARKARARAKQRSRMPSPDPAPREPDAPDSPAGTRADLDPTPPPEPSGRHMSAEEAEAYSRARSGAPMMSFRRPPAASAD